MHDQYLINMLFAEELLEFLYTEVYLLFGFNVLWRPELAILDMKCKRGKIYDSVFDEEIGWAVYHVINQNIKDIQDCYKDFLYRPQQSTELVDGANFTKCALKIAPLFFSKGYSHGSFLAYCGMVIGVAYNYFLLNPNCIPQRACQVVALVLFKHQMTGQFHEEGGWKGFYCTAANFVQSMDALLEKRNSDD